jgi:acetyl-CoA carboxylase biotin carboxyl carrier protein
VDISTIEQLIKVIENSGVKEFSYKDEEMEVSISTLDHPPVIAPASGPAYVAQPAAPAAQAVADEPKVDEEEYITSPIVATFYSAAAPDVPAYVRVGDRVKAGETVCILEAMKLMNEITAEFDCEIEAILVSNEQHVEYGQPLFRVKRL